MLGNSLKADRLDLREQTTLNQILRQFDFVDIIFQRFGTFQGDLGMHGIALEEHLDPVAVFRDGEDDAGGVLDRRH